MRVWALGNGKESVAVVFGFEGMIGWNICSNATIAAGSSLKHEG